MGDEEHAEKITVTLGQLSVSVEGNDPAHVEETFEEVWEKTLSDADSMSKDVHRAVRGWE